MAAAEPFHWCCCGGIKRLDNHWLLWGRPRSRFPFQGMVGPHWRVGLWTFLCIPAGTAGWACLIIFAAPNDGDDEVRKIIVIVGAVIALISMATYLSTACTDPGIVFKNTAPSMTGDLAGRSSSGNGSRTVSAAPAGAGTPTPLGEAAQGPQRSSTHQRHTQDDGTAAWITANFSWEGRADEAYTTADLEAQQILEILEDDYQQGKGIRGAETTSTAAPSIIGLPPDQCLAAADAGSTAVSDMRNAPFPQQPQPWAPPVANGGETTNCGRCQIVRPAGAVHCSVCGVCVDRLDHHCPFMGQCVGKKTLMMFYVFVVTVWFLIVYVVVAIAYLVVAMIVNGI